MSTWTQNNDNTQTVQKHENPERLHFIADYCSQRRLSFSEVRQALWDRGVSNINCVPVKPFSTVEAGFALQQLALHDNVSANSYFYLNVAPRKDSLEARNDNDGEPLVYAELESGAKIVATSSGFSLSFVRSEIEELRNLNVSTNGSQFRSRDIFPEAVEDVFHGDEELLGEELSKDRIPETPDSRVGYIDGFGNIKTTVRKSEIDTELGDSVTVELGDRKVNAVRKNGIFGVKEGETVFAPGSSGGEDPFMEIVVRGGSAEEKLGKPDIGQKIHLSGV